MAGIVTVRILNGSHAGREWRYTEHDLFTFGRESDCDAVMPESDLQVSRHHFVLEVNPPDAFVRDLGSRNRTYVNELPYGGRNPDETPEEGAQQQYPAVPLHDGDRIRVGQTEIAVQIESPVFCFHCVMPIPLEQRDTCRWIGDTYLHPKCRAEIPASQLAMKPEPPRCQSCGGDVSDEIGSGRRGDYICSRCRKTLHEQGGDQLKRSVQAVVARAGQLRFHDLQFGRELGGGAFGKVYEARLPTGEVYAVKIMLSEVAVDPRSRKTFLREVEIGRSLRHPNLVPILDYGVEGSLFFFIMELCSGGSLQDLFDRKRRPLTVAEAGPLMLQALDGMAYAHRQKSVHRDVKPANILLTGETPPVVKVADFGLAKSFSEAGFTYSCITQPDELAGTFPFMPPEQITNFRDVRPVSDVYALGATLYYLLTGYYPRDFPDRSDCDWVRIVMNPQALIPIQQRDGSIPRRVAEVIDRALSHRATLRYPDAGEFRASLAAEL